MLHRLVALAVFLFAVYIAVSAHHGGFGMLGPVVFICAVVVAIVAFARILFKLPFAQRYPDSGFGMSEPVGFGIGSFSVLIFAVVPLFIAGKGVYTGILPALGSGPDIAFSGSPARFIGVLLFWLAVGWGVSWLFLKVRGAKKGDARGESDA